MLLDQIEIVGFRGINRLSLNVEELSVFIGENRWGKSSFLDALSLFLSGTRKNYKFCKEDFHQPPNPEIRTNKLIHLVFTFKEQWQGEARLGQYKTIKKLWVNNIQALRYIYYQVDGELSASGNIKTSRYFLDAQGEKKAFIKDELSDLVSEFISFVPVLRMGSDTPQLLESVVDKQEHSTREKFENRIKHIFRRLNDSSQQLSEHQLKQGYEALTYLFDHYLFKRYADFDYHRVDFGKDIHSHQPFLFKALTHFHALLKQGNKRDRAMLLLILGEFLTVRGEHLLRRGATPILLLEEPENNLHPVNLAITWRFFSLLPMQKLVTTNSSQLLSFFPLSSIQRLLRQQDIIKSYRLESDNYSADDLRRITFHVRMTRPQSFFARSWLLVEGETETWLLTELARFCGYHLVIEGVQIIEFAQCGLSPLIKLAQDFNIEWHVLTDGDVAGKKYASRVENMLVEEDSLVNRLTVLPAMDIEHLFFDNGFADIYLQAANYTEQDLSRLSVHKVIEKAVHKYSKPGLGLTIASAIEERGIESIPLLFKRLFTRLVALARAKSG